MGLNEPLILDFQMLLTSIPPWLLEYSTAKMGCITAMMKTRGSQSQYKNFTGDLCKTLTSMQCHSLEKALFKISISCWIHYLPSFSTPNTAILWTVQLMISWVTYKSFIQQGAQVKHSPTLIVKSVNFHQSDFVKFSKHDLERLKDNNKWLSDSHVMLSLL